MYINRERHICIYIICKYIYTHIDIHTIYTIYIKKKDYYTIWKINI